MPFKKRKQEPGPPPRNTEPNGSNTCKDYMASVGASSGFKDGRPPSISTLFNKLSAEVGGGGNRGVRSKAGPSGSCPTAAGGGRGGGGGGGGRRSQVSAGKLLHSEDQITEGLEPVSSFTIPPTEEDLKQLQYGPDKNGHIKKSPKAFTVWCHIHRKYALRKNGPGPNMIDISTVLGSEWSKLSEEQKRPYYEVALKLKCMQEQQILDSVLRQQKKKHIECLSSGQGAGQNPGISFSQAVPPAQSNLKGPMYPYPPTVPYGLPTYPISSNLRVRNNHLGFSTGSQIPTAPQRK